MNITLISEPLASTEMLRNILAELSNSVSVTNITTEPPQDLRADLVIINLHSMTLERLNLLKLIQQQCAVPILVFAEKPGQISSSEVVQTGMCTYVVDGLEAKRIATLVEVTIARFNQIHFLQDELINTKNELAARKDIERAKGILMKQKGITEEDAYKTLQKTAMNQNKRLADVAKNVISLAHMM